MLNRNVRFEDPERGAGVGPPDPAGVTGCLRRVPLDIWAWCRRAFRHWRSGFVLIPLPLSMTVGAKSNQGRLFALVLAFWVVNALLPRSWRMQRRRSGEVVPGIRACDVWTGSLKKQ